MRAQAAGLDLRSSHDTERNRPVGAANPSSPPSSSSFAFHVSAPTFPLKFSRHDHEFAAEPHFHGPRHDEACLKRKRTNELDHPGPIRKKRRLRLTLITSRLSLPFAVPTTHIIDRGRSRIAVWAKQKALGRSLLRKAAILNRVTRTVETAIDKSPNMAAGRRGEIEMLRRKGIEMTRLARLRGSLATVNSTRPVAIPEVMEGSRAVRPASSMFIESPNFRPSGTSVDSTRKHYAPSPPSPLSQSNSDPLDLEDEEKNEQGRPEHAGAEEDDQDDDAYFDSIIFGVAAASPSTNNSVFVSEYDRLDDLDDDDYSSSIFSSACASPSATTATALTAEEEALAACDDTGSIGTTLFDHLTGISSEDAAPPVAPPPPSQRPKGWNPNFASAPPLPPMPAEGEASQQRKDSKVPEQSSSPSEDDRLAEIMQEKERQRWRN
ncbi:hypothetical protein B0J12DRAFT_178043 [Macrophomina phaseolina]|uniref:Uncharacterized protein n=1 Tax=Macrophomina phaseolina TaxID=35725 RepID=A0ABQ8GT50_9PEZI|nr:hypothetical protein B0J12DRAFT_178043 [Macrophomina phaseolina]